MNITVQYCIITGIMIGLIFIFADSAVSKSENEPMLTVLVWLKYKIKNQKLSPKQAYKYSYIFFNHFYSGKMINELFVKSDTDLEYILRMYSLHFVLDNETSIDNYNDLIDKLIEYLEECCASLLRNEHAFNCKKCLEVTKKYKGIFNK